MERVLPVVRGLVALAGRAFPGFDAVIEFDERVGICAPGAPSPCRQFGACAPGPRIPTIYLSPRLEREPVGRIAGVSAHEVGHALLLWSGVHTHTEREADLAAEHALGLQIAYDAGDVQTTGPGARPRPSRLG